MLQNEIAMKIRDELRENASESTNVDEKAPIASIGPVQAKFLHVKACVTLCKGLQDAMSVFGSFLAKN